ncbi:hypothetical protein GZ77_01670 [Endozoicomonas montiporae]|uniref:GT44 domain-containing protein n=2 Tax=Endozoicomonas montiporae TaxID=1027273 RepID=A0A081NAB0_9GAMM|nr:hypothetical protein [Endozoicomonas montiporae]AMO56935.1 hypothetical protein EZMO1_2891 [Endozoicomonas montiporae CL-33]KEQ15383.1 hypothetical protein GZ77_01670 [Endozoicomonas montiporae]
MMMDPSVSAHNKRNSTDVPSYREPSDFKYAVTGKDGKSKGFAPFAVPRKVNTIWLGKMNGGKIPDDRFANMLSFSKQFAASGWQVNVWVNKPIIWHRACCQLALGEGSCFKGLALETHSSPLCCESEKKDISLRKIKVCEDWLLFSQLDNVNKQCYDRFHERYNLPYLKNLNAAVVTDAAEKAPVLRAGVYEAEPFKKTLLDYYREKLVGRRNFAAAADFLRSAAQISGGVYVDSDTKAAGVSDPPSKFDELYALNGIILAEGWKSGYNNDLFASLPDSHQIQYILLDQYCHAVMFKDLPYVVWSRETDGYSCWSKRAVAISPSGLKMTPRELSYCTHGQGNKNLVSLADVARFPGYFYQKVTGAVPATQQGLYREDWQEQISENTENLRFVLTLHSPGPWTLNRMDEVFELSGKDYYLFENRSPDAPLKQINPDETLSVTEWGGLTRMNTISWDQGGKVSSSELESYDDSELGELQISKDRWLSERDHSSGLKGS